MRNGLPDGGGHVTLWYTGSVLKVFVIALSALIASGASVGNGEPSVAQQAPSVSCVHSGLDLEYPVPALDSRIMGLATTRFETGENGEIRRLEAKGHPLLAAGAEAALRAARFSGSCFGRTIVIRFNFRLDQDLDPHTPVAVKAVSVDEFEIVAPGPRIEIAISDPAWIFSRKGRFLHRVNRCLSKLRFWLGRRARENHPVRLGIMLTMMTAVSEG